MKVVVLGGAGAMGCCYGSYLARAGHDVWLLDVARESVETINHNGLQVTDPSGKIHTVPIRATMDPNTPGVADLVIVFVKGMHTSEATRHAIPVIGPDTNVLTLQNGWGNVARISEVVDKSQVLAGVSIHSVTLLGPGRIHHSNTGETYVGELEGSVSERITHIAEALTAAGLPAHPVTDIQAVIWSKLSLNACSLPECGLLGLRSGQLMDSDDTITLMRAVLREVVNVAWAMNIGLDYEERWNAISEQLRKAANVRCSMLQDIERKRETEIETITGAIVAEGGRHGVPTPYNNALLLLIRAKQWLYLSPAAIQTPAS